MASSVQKQSQQAATIPATIAKAAACVLPLVPAIRVNLDSAAGQGSAWVWFAIGSVVASAVFIELTLEGQTLAKRALFAALAAFFLSLNVLNAIGNAASASDVSRSLASSQSSRAQRLAEQRSQLSQSRKDQVAVAGNTTPESIDADMRAAKATNARLWSSTFECDPRWSTREFAREFCSSIAEMEKKRAAATRRDEIDRDLAALDNQNVDAAPAPIDSYVANVARFMSMMGFSVDDHRKELLASSRDWLKGVGVELLAALGPAALLSLLLHPVAPSQASPQAQRKPEKPVKDMPAPIAAPEAETVTPSQCDDPEIDCFIGKRLEAIQGEHVAATALFNAWRAYCAERGIEPGSQKAFSKRVQRRVGYDRNNGRPRYMHVKLRARTPIHLAISNAGARAA